MKFGKCPFNGFGTGFETDTLQTLIERSLEKALEGGVKMWKKNENIRSFERDLFLAGFLTDVRS